MIFRDEAGGRALARGAARRVLPALVALFVCHAAFAEGLLRIANCRIVDDHGPVKAMGVNYVDGFWNFVKDGKREAYLPYLDALAKANVPFIRMSLAPWAPYKPGASVVPQVVDFVNDNERYFDRLDIFLNDLQARHIGAVLDVFWQVDPYTAYFNETATASTIQGSKTSNFLQKMVVKLAQREGKNSAIWMIEFINEGNLDIDFGRANHSRGELTAMLNHLATALRAAGDQHLLDSGNSMPRPAAEHLSEREGWKLDTQNEFLAALGAESPADFDVTSIHFYPEAQGQRSWDNAALSRVLSVLSAYGRKSCRPVFVGEFGASGIALASKSIDDIQASDVQLAAVWGFGRPGHDPFAFQIDEPGRKLLGELTGEVSR